MTKVTSLRACVVMNEQMLFDTATDPIAKYVWHAKNGGDATRKSFLSYGMNIKKSFAFFKQFGLYYETGDFICAHAGISSLGPRQTSKDIFLEDRSVAECGLYSRKLFIYGHTPMYEPLFQDGNGYQQALKSEVVYDLPKYGSICLDTGCVFSYKLTCMMIYDNEKFSIESVEKEQSAPTT